MKPRWKQYVRYTAVITGVGILAYIILETIRAKNTGFETKTLWDWMELLVIPLVLATGVFYLEHSEREIERQRAEERARLERQYADERAKREEMNAQERARFDRLHAEERAHLEREIAADIQQEATLQSYLDRMADLLFKENLRVSENSEVRHVARIRTLTVLRALDENRKRIVLIFLHESGLIGPRAVVDLQGADLFEAELGKIELLGANLMRADLGKAKLFAADLQYTNLRDAILVNCQLSESNLSEADLRGANLAGADLEKANLNRADLRGANLHNANLSHVNLQGARIEAGQLANVQSLTGATLSDGTKL